MVRGKPGVVSRSVCISEVISIRNHYTTAIDQNDFSCTASRSELLVLRVADIPCDNYSLAVEVSTAGGRTGSTNDTKAIEVELIAWPNTKNLISNINFSTLPAFNTIYRNLVNCDWTCLRIDVVHVPVISGECPEAVEKLRNARHSCNA